MATTPGNSVNETTTGIAGFTGTAFTGTAATQYAVLVGGATSSTLSNVGPTSTSGQVLQSAGASANPAFSTATYPTTATGTGTILRADGTNWAATTSTYPNTNAINTLLYASSANVMSALATANSGVLSTSSAGVPSIDTTNFAVLSTGLQLKGNNTNTAPPAGFIGEQIRNTGSGVNLPNTTITNVTSINLTAGVWDICGIVAVIYTGAATAAQIAISANTGSLTGTVLGDSQWQSNISTTGGDVTGSISGFRVVLSTTTTYYLVAGAFFSTGAASGNGRISATRVG